MVAQLIKIFPRILWKLQIILQFMGMPFNGLSKYEYLKSILTQFPRIYFNIILPYSHRSSKQSPSCLFSNQKSLQDYHHSHAFHIPYPSATVLQYPSI